MKKKLFACTLVLGLFAEGWLKAQVPIDNGLPTNVVGHLDIVVNAGASINPYNLTAERLASMDVHVDDLIFDYDSYVDVGAGGIILGDTTITMVPTLIGPASVQSAGTFTGSGGNTIEWITTTTLTGDLDIETIHEFRARTGTLGNIRLQRYLDEDVDDSVGDDVLIVRGSAAAGDLELFTIDNTEVYGLSHGGAYAAGLSNATFIGFAADEYSELQTDIENGTATYELDGNINTVNLPPFNHPVVGAGFGPRDITSSLAWDVDPTATEAVIRTGFGGEPDDTTVQVRGSVSGNIWLDIVGEDGDPSNDDLSAWGLGDVDVILEGPDGTRTTTTFLTNDMAGFYIFTNVTPGDYTVRIDEATVTADWQDYTTTSQHLFSVSNDTPQAFDIGLQPLYAEINGTVWDDINANDILDENLVTTAVDGVEVDLMVVDSMNVTMVLAQTTTDALGGYEFTNLFSGGYTLRVNPDTNLHPWAVLPEAQATTLGAGATNTVDFPITVNYPSTIEGTVWFDESEDGSPDDEDLSTQGVANVQVLLFEGDGAGGFMFQELTTTDNNGEYSFSNLLDNIYLVEVNTDTLLQDLQTADAERITVVLPIETIRRADFPLEYKPSTVNAIVWIDADGNNNTNETLATAGVVGQTVRLEQRDNEGNFQFLETADTGAGGLVSFDDLDAGVYRLQLSTNNLPAMTTPPASLNLIVPVGVNDSVTGLFPLDPVIPPPVGTNAHVNGVVWCDVVGADGDPDNDDLTANGLAGVTVRLFSRNADNSVTPLESHVTTPGGNYSFSNLAVGDYVVAVILATLPINTTSLTTNFEYDFSVTTAGVQEFNFGVLKDGEPIQPPPAPAAQICGTAWLDIGTGTTGDGIPNERLDTLGLSGLDVILYRVTGSTSSFVSRATTARAVVNGENNNGYYSFGRLDPGTYVVMLDTSTVGFAVDQYSTPIISARVTVSTGSKDTVNFGLVSVPTSVDLLAFVATEHNGKLLVSWAANDGDALGYHVHRAERENGDYEQQTEALIPARGTASGGEYHLLLDAAPGWLLLESIGADGTSELHGPFATRTGG